MTEKREPAARRPARAGQPVAPRRALFSGAAVVVTLLALTAGLWWVFGRGGEPVSFTVDGRVLTVFDSQKRLLWSHTFPQSLLCAPSHACVLFTDADGDGHTETIFNYDPVIFSDQTVPGGGSELWLFDRAGRVKWSRKFGTAFVTTTGEHYPGQLYSLSLLGRLSKPRVDGGVILAGGHFESSWIYQVEIFTADGRKVGSYLHPGWFFTMAVTDLNNDGVEEVLLGGVNNGYEETGYAATLVALDSRRISGQGSVPPGTGRQAADLPTGEEAAVLLFRDYAPVTNPYYYCRIIDVAVAGGEVQAHGVQGLAGAPQLDYHLDSHLRLTAIQPDPGFADKLLTGLRKPLTEAARQREFMRRLGGIKVLRNEFDTRP